VLLPVDIGARVGLKIQDFFVPDCALPSPSELQPTENLDQKLRVSDGDETHILRHIWKLTGTEPETNPLPVFVTKDGKRQLVLDTQESISSIWRAFCSIIREAVQMTETIQSKKPTASWSGESELAKTLDRLNTALRSIHQFATVSPSLWRILGSPAMEVHWQNFLKRAVCRPPFPSLSLPGGLPRHLPFQKPRPELDDDLADDEALPDRRSLVATVHHWLHCLCQWTSLLSRFDKPKGSTYRMFFNQSLQICILPRCEIDEPSVQAGLEETIDHALQATGSTMSFEEARDTFMQEAARLMPSGTDELLTAMADFNEDMWRASSPAQAHCEAYLASLMDPINAKHSLEDNANKALHVGQSGQ
jgi:hypothetical protein